MINKIKKELWIKILFIVFMALIILLSIPLNNVSAEGFGYRKNNNNQVPDIGRYQKIIADTNTYYVGQGKTVYLTFDCGYDNGNLDDILNTLKKKDVKATFFVTGDFVTRFSNLLKRIVDDNHLVGNHSYTHKTIDKMNDVELLNDLEKLENKYYQLTNKNLAKIFRPPEGRFNRKALELLNKAGYKTFFWSIALVDWKDTKVDTYQEVINNLHDGAIILLHSVSKDNNLALGKIIDEIKRQGYEFKLLTEI